MLYFQKVQDYQSRSSEQRIMPKTWKCIELKIDLRELQRNSSDLLKARDSILVPSKSKGYILGVVETRRRQIKGGFFSYGEIENLVEDCPNNKKLKDKKNRGWGKYLITVKTWDDSSSEDKAQ